MNFPQQKKRRRYMSNKSLDLDMLELFCGGALMITV